MTSQEQEFWSIEKDYFEHKVSQKYELQTAPGLTEETIRQISQDKQEPQWMLDFRLRCFELYKKLPMPNNWPDGPDLKELDLKNISYYVKPGTQQASDWNNVPPEIKKTFERLGIPEAERHSLAGAGAQFEAEVVYHNLKKQWEDLGVLFTDCDVALKEHPELFKKYFMKCVPPSLHKFAALHGAVWSGGTFIHIPKGVKVDLPLQAYFRMNVANAGQFEHTLIIVDEGAEVSYIEGCFTKGTKITTNPNFKPIEQIQVGDKVLSHAGEFKKVYHVHERPLYSGNLYKIKIWGDSTGEIECTQEHPFLRVKRERANERNKTWVANWTQAQYLNHLDYLLMPINRKVITNNHRDFKVQFKNKEDIIRIDLTKDFFRLIGYYLAEGSVSKNSYLNFSFGSKEREYIDDVKRILKNIGITSIHEAPHKKNNGISVVVGNAKLARLFKEFGTSAATKGLPLWVLLEEPEKQKEMLIGLFRGDGNYFNVKYKSGLKESLRLNTVSERLARQTRDTLLRLNIVSFINKRIRKKDGRQTMYTVGITGEYINKMGGLLGIKIKDNLNGKKRATMFYLDDKYAYVPIRKITKKKVKKIKVYNFAVEGDETYTVQGVTVHNCSAPTYTTSSLHAGCVEIFVNKGARARYSSMENWAKNVFNLNTKRAIVDEDGVIEWVNGNMGCLTEDSLIYTNPKGPTKIVSLKPGDHVFALDEKEKKLKRAKVKAIVYSGDKKVYSLRVAGREVKASANHPFLTLQRKKIKLSHKKSKFYYEWKPLEMIKEGDLIAIAKKIPDMGRPYLLPKIKYGGAIKSNNQYSKFSMSTKHLFKEISLSEYTTEDLMWFWGVYIGDGNLWKPKKGGAKINIAIHEKSDLRKPLIEVIKRVFNYEVKYQKDRYIIINSNMLAKLLGELGFSGLASSKRIPQWVYTLPVTQRLAFLGGYFDADGHIEKGGAYLTSINKELLEDSKQLAISCGIGVSRIFNHMPPGKRVILGKECNASGSYRLLLNGKEVVHIGTKSSLYKNKLNSLRTRRDYSTGNRMNFSHQTSDEVGFAKIDKITYQGIKPTYDIEVENYHNFIANGIIVHNSKTTMLYPCSILKGKNARADFLGVAVASKNQFQDTGAKVIHAAPNTSSTIRSKSISKDGGITTYRGLVQVAKNAANAKVYVQCDALMLDDHSKSNTVPYIDVDNKTAEVGHEATVSKIGDEQLFYLMSRGLSEEQARQMIVSGFIEPIVKALPIEYAVEFNRLIELEMENALG